MGNNQAEVTTKIVDRLIPAKEYKLASHFAGQILYAMRQDNWFFVHQGRKHGGFADIIRLEIVNNSPLAVVKNLDGKYQVYHDGIVGYPYTAVSGVVFRHGKLMYSAQLEDGSWSLVINHKESQDSYKGILGFCTTHEGELRMAVRQGTRVSVLYDGQRRLEWDDVWGFQFAGGQEVYAGREGKEIFVLQGASAMGPWYGVWNLKTVNGKPAFSIQTGVRYEVYMGQTNWRAPAFVQEVAGVNKTPFFSYKEHCSWTVGFGDRFEGGYRRVGRLYSNHLKPLYDAVLHDGLHLIFGRDKLTEDPVDEVVECRALFGDVASICRKDSVYTVRFKDHSRSYARAFSLCKNKKSLSFGAFDGRDIIVVEQNV